MNRAKRDTEPQAVALVEEAVHLLRRTPAIAWAWYLAGTVPFVVGLLFFWAHTAWFGPTEGGVTLGALVLAILFVPMKTAQSVFCAHLLAVRSESELPRWSARRLAAVASAQLRLQPWALVGAGVAAILTVPFGWVCAYGQIATVLGADDALHHESVTHARRWPGQNHLGLLLISAIAMCAWLNLATAFLAAPWLANHVLGIDNIFGFSGWSLLNTTFLASVSALTWLAVDPLVKAFYTLWVFHGQARRTGEDIRIEVLRGRTDGRVAMAAIVLFAVSLFTIPQPALASPAATVSTTPPPAVQPTELNRAIDETLDAPDFSWRLRPLPKPANEAPKGFLAELSQQLGRAVKSAFKAVGRWIDRLVDWLRRRDRSHSAPVHESAGVSAGLVSAMVYGFIALLVLLLVWIVWIVVRQWQRSRVTVVAAEAVAFATPDLRDHNVHAGQLAPDEWLQLAQTEMARGEWRLALRAVYLATLARFAADGLVSLARFKTNLDYEREVRRRATARTEVVDRFRERRRTFEDVWYGERAADEATVRTWFDELRQPKAVP